MLETPNVHTSWTETWLNPINHKWKTVVPNNYRQAGFLAGRSSLFCSLSQTGCFSPPTVYDKTDYIHIIVIPLTQIINIFSSHKLKLALLFDLTSMAQDRRVRTRRQHWNTTFFFFKILISQILLHQRQVHSFMPWDIFLWFTTLPLLLQNQFRFIPYIQFNCYNALVNRRLLTD